MRPRRRGRRAHRRPCCRCSRPISPTPTRSASSRASTRSWFGSAQRARHRCRPAAPSAESHPHPMSGTRSRGGRRARLRRRYVHHDAAVVIDGPDIVAVVPRAELPSGCRCASFPRAPGSHRASSTCRSTAAATCCSTTRRRRRRIGKNRGGASQVRHHRAAADADQRQPREDAGGDCRGRSPRRRRSGRARHSSRRPVPVARAPGVHASSALRTPTDADPPDARRAARRVACWSRWRPNRCRRASSPSSYGAGVRVALGHSMATYAQTRPPWPKGSPASRTCSTPCGRWRAASPGRSRRRWKSPQAWFGMIVDGMHVASGHAAPGAARRRAPDAGDRCDAAGRREQRPAFVSTAKRSTVRDGRCAQAGRHARRRLPRHGERGAQLRAPARAAAHRRAAVRLAQSRLLSRARRSGSACSRPAIAPTWWRSTRMCA